MGAWRRIDVILLWVFGIWNALSAIAAWILVFAHMASPTTTIFAPINTLFAVVLIYFAVRYKKYL
jgi:hypothetical protein